MDAPTTILDLPDAILICIASRLDLNSLASLRCSCTLLERAARAALNDLKVVALANGMLAKTSPAGPTLLLQSLLPHCPLLTSLCLKGAHSWVGDSVLQAIATGAPQLVSLDLEHCSLITGAGLEALCAKRLARLKTLCMRSCGSIGNGSPLARLPSLVDLDLGWCHSVAAAALAPLAPQLQRLSLHGCELIDDSLCERLPCIQALDAAFTKVGDAGLRSLAAGSPALRTLVLAARGFNLWTTGAWSEAGLHHFRASRPGVAVLLRNA